VRVYSIFYSFSKNKVFGTGKNKNCKRNSVPKTQFLEKKPTSLVQKTSFFEKETENYSR